DLVFGYPGGAIMPVYDALLDAHSIRHILVRHEQGASHMADGYARATGQVGVCIATSGPGATNLVTGIATAYMDSSPVVAITEHSFLIRRTVDIPRVFAEAFHIARTGRPGPVWIDIPKDIQTQKGPYLRPEKVFLPGYSVPGRADERDIDRVIAALQAAKRPVLYIGGGAIWSGASEVIERFVTLTGIPITTTLMGLGAYPRYGDYSLGMLGMHGALYANKTMNEADLVIAAGARFDDRVTGKKETFIRRAKVIHIDVDPAEHSKNVPCHIPVSGDVKLVFEQILERLCSPPPPPRGGVSLAGSSPPLNGSGTKLRDF